MAVNKVALPPSSQSLVSIFRPSISGASRSTWASIVSTTITIFLLQPIRLYSNNPDIRMAPAKKMRHIPLPKRALIEPYSSPTNTRTPALEGVAADGSQSIASSPSESNALSRSKTVTPSPSKTNARANPFMQYRWTVANPATKWAVVQAVRV
ncbi:hypothetical protein CsSME_00034036 [Camellia sinensis var. sinensis]